MGKSCRLLLALVLLLLAAPAFAAPCGGDFNAFLAAIARDAQGQGVSRAVIDQAFAGLTPDPAVLAFDRRQRGMFQKPADLPVQTHEYVGVDVAEAPLAYARWKHADANAHFQRDDALALSFHENEFDAAVSAYVINFFPEPRKMVAEMKRVVRPSGTVAACTWDFAGNRPVAQHIAAAMAARNSTALKRATSAQHADSTRPEAMEQIFGDVGLKDVTTISIDTLVTYRDFDDYWISNTDFSSILSNLVNELTVQDREQFKAEVKALVPISADGSIQYTVGTIAAKGLVPNR